MASSRSTLKAASRADFGSRSTRRMRREGIVPGVVYSGGSEATPFQVSDRDLRSILIEGAALFDLEIEGSKAVPVVIKDEQRHPVRGDVQHLDLMQVNLKEAIQAEVALELEGVDDAPGVKGGGVLEHVTREITVEALPAEIPDNITIDVSSLEINDTLSLATVTPPEGVSFVAEELEEITIVTVSPPRVEEATPELEEEAELVGEAEGGDDAADESGDSGDSGGE